MQRSSPGGAVATLAVVALVVLAPAAALVPAAALPPGDDPSTYAFAQGTTCTPITPVADGTRNVSAFYDYRNPNTDPSSGTYSSFGTTDYQYSEGSSLLVYAGENGTSLVVVHDRRGDESGGSTVTFEFSDLPTDGEWVVQDDRYDGRDDDWTLDDTSATIDWKWGDNRTDGGAYSGLANMTSTIVIDPGFNEDATYWGEWGYSGSEENRITDWFLRGADGTEQSLDMDRRVFVHRGTCQDDATPPSASVTGPSSTSVGENVTFDAGETSDDGTIGGYEWDVDGDGEVDAVTQDPTFEHAFSEASNHTVSVTAFDTYGNGDTETMDVTATAVASPPTATLSVPSTTTVNDTVTLNASGSTDEGTIEEYRWDLDGDGTVDRNTTEPTTEYAYSNVSEYEPSVTVVDDDGSQDTASASLSVTATDEPPDAVLTGPANATTGVAVTFNASASTDDEDIEEYRWDVDGDGEAEETNENPVRGHTYEEPGNYTVEVTVVDTANQTATDTHEITVEAVESPPTAVLDVPGTATVNDTVTLNASASTDDEGIEEYRWDIDGDGETDATTTDDPTFEYAYPESGEYEPSVTVVDGDGLNDTANATITVENASKELVAALDVPETATVNETVTFNASDSTPMDAIDKYQWDADVEDGEIDEPNGTEAFEHTYEEPGTYDVGVTVVDGDGLNDTANASIQVQENATLDPVVQVTADDPTAGSPVSFDASGSTATPAGTIADYEWDFGDGGTATGETATHTYADSGDYEVTLTVTTDGGVTANATTTVSVARPSNGDGGNGGDGGTGGGDNGDDDGGNGGGGDDGGSGGGSGGGGAPGGGGDDDDDDGGSSSDGSSGGSGSSSPPTQQPADPPEPNISDVNVSLGSETLVEGETLVVTATVSNTGDGPGNKGVEFEVEGEVVETRNLVVGPNETRTVTFSHRFTTPGTKTIRVDYGEKHDVEVRPARPNISVVSLDVNESVEAGGQFTVTATVENTGHADGSRALELVMFDEVVAVENVSVPVGERETVTFAQEVLSAGAYDASVGNETVTVSVTGADTTTTADETPAQTSSETPGLGLIASVVAIAIAAAALVRRRR